MLRQAQHTQKTNNEKLITPKNINQTAIVNTA